MNTDRMMKEAEKAIQFYSSIHSKRTIMGIVKAKERRLKEYYANGEISKTEFETEIAKLKAKLEQLQQI